MNMVSYSFLKNSQPSKEVDINNSNTETKSYFYIKILLHLLIG